MSLKKCICINHKGDELEYQPLAQLLSPYAKVIPKFRIVKERLEGRYQLTDKKIDESYILINHPSNSTAQYNILLEDKDKYNLVINKSKNSAYPVHKKFFTENAYIDKPVEKAKKK